MKQIRVKPDQVHKSNLYKIGYIFTNIYIGCRGVVNQRNAANLEYICNLVGIRGILKLKGALGRIALIGSYRIWLARYSQEWSAGELIIVKE